jgi:hypothetical protein
MNVTLEYTCEMDERDWFEVHDKGVFQHAVAVLPGGRRVPVSFWDPIRLRQDIEFHFNRGKTCFSEVGLIVVPSITHENMTVAVNELYVQSFFEHLR